MCGRDGSVEEIKGKYFGAWRERAMMVACNFFVRGRDKNTIFYV
jgi:hypothetical protein